MTRITLTIEFTNVSKIGVDDGLADLVRRTERFANDEMLTLRAYPWLPGTQLPEVTVNHTFAREANECPVCGLVNPGPEHSAYAPMLCAEQ